MIRVQVTMGFLLATIPQYGITTHFSRRQVFLKSRQALRNPKRIQGAYPAAHLGLGPEDQSG
jgi:hypothetical protein